VRSYSSKGGREGGGEEGREGKREGGEKERREEGEGLIGIGALGSKYFRKVSVCREHGASKPTDSITGN
jgi:hypothetical protein